MRFIVIGLVILLHGQAISAAPLASLVQAAGLRAVDEPQPAADFQLSDLAGSSCACKTSVARWCYSISGPPGVIPVCKKCH